MRKGSRAYSSGFGALGRRRNGLTAEALEAADDDEEVDEEADGRGLYDERDEVRRAKSQAKG